MFGFHKSFDNFDGNYNYIFINYSLHSYWTPSNVKVLKEGIIFFSKVGTVDRGTADPFFFFFYLFIYLFIFCLQKVN